MPQLFPLDPVSQGKCKILVNDLPRGDRAGCILSVLPPLGTVSCEIEVPPRSGYWFSLGVTVFCYPMPMPMHASATSMLKTLHWLPVKARIQYKIACLCFQCLCHNTMPSYLSDILHPYLPPRTLRSLDTSLLTIPRFCLETYGRRSLSVFGPTVWNSLPLSLRKTQCFSTFKKKLKNYLFEKHLC